MKKKPTFACLCIRFFLLVSDASIKKKKASSILTMAWLECKYQLKKKLIKFEKIVISFEKIQEWNRFHSNLIILSSVLSRLFQLGRWRWGCTAQGPILCILYTEVVFLSTNVLLNIASICSVRCNNHDKLFRI